MRCKYEKQNGRCDRTALESSEKGFCILHEDWSHKNKEESQKIFYRMQSNKWLNGRKAHNFRVEEGDCRASIHPCRARRNER